MERKKRKQDGLRDEGRNKERGRRGRKVEGQDKKRKDGRRKGSRISLWPPVTC